MELDRLVEAGSIERRLRVRCERDPILEPDDRALIDAEQVAGLLSERAVAQVAREAMRQPEVALEPRQPQRRRQIDDDEVRFGRIPDRIVIVLNDHGCRRGLCRIRCRLSQRGARAGQMSDHARGDHAGASAGQLSCD
jgi:hypothetical protein